MEFLSLPTLAIAAAVTIPPLVALYFLKLKRAVKVVPSTLLWKRAVEDLHVNSPFQRLRGSLLLLLQLLILILAAIALGKPMLEQADQSESTVVILIDQSASMAVVEADGKTRLERAKEQAKGCIDNLQDDARAMIVALCDRATVVSTFDTNKTALKARVDTIEQTESTTTLSEAISLAEAYTQKITIAGDEPSRTVAPSATVYLFTDGRIGDAARVSLQEFEAGKILVHNVGARSDNVGIMSLQARRNYESPDRLQVSATMRNFATEPIAFDAVLYVNGSNVDIQSVSLAAGRVVAENGQEDGDAIVEADPSEPLPGSVGLCVFDELRHGGGGVIEVSLRVDDALLADNRAWTIVEEPRSVRVLCVTEGNPALERALSVLPLRFETMTSREYEEADDEKLLDGKRSRFDVVILDGHSTKRLPQGNYLFWGAVPHIDGVAAGKVIENEVIFNWDDTHPVLRYVAAEAIRVYEWLHLDLPGDAVSIIDGETSPVLSYLTRDASQYLICAFRLIVEDESGYQLWNTDWVTQVDFVVFMQNAIQFLSSNIATKGRKSVSPGEPVTLPIPEGTAEVTIRRPDNTTDQVPSAGYQTIHYARTRRVGTYRVEPAVAGEDIFAVNLFDAVESRVDPAPILEIGATSVETQSTRVVVNRPAWKYFLLAMLVFLAFEWVVYNLRVFV